MTGNHFKWQRFDQCVLLSDELILQAERLLEFDPEERRNKVRLVHALECRSRFASSAGLGVDDIQPSLDRAIRIGSDPDLRGSLRANEALIQVQRSRGFMFINTLEIEPAIEQFRTVIERQQILAMAEPGNVRRGLACSSSRMVLGMLYRAQRDNGPAIRELQSALDDLERILEVDPESQRILMTTAATLWTLAETQFRSGDRNGVLQTTERLREVRDRLQKPPNVVRSYTRFVPAGLEADVDEHDHICTRLIHLRMQLVKNDTTEFDEMHTLLREDVSALEVPHGQLPDDPKQKSDDVKSREAIHDFAMQMLCSCYGIARRAAVDAPRKSVYASAIRELLRDLFRRKWAPLLDTRINPDFTQFHKEDWFRELGSQD